MISSKCFIIPLKKKILNNIFDDNNQIKFYVKIELILINFNYYF